MDNRFIYGLDDNREYMAGNACELLDFGRHFASEGGSSYYLGDDGTPWKDRPRQTWITSRMAHVYSIGAMLLSSDNTIARSDHSITADECARLAAKAIEGLKFELHDDINGGWYAGINADGNIMPDKQCYAHAFVILAASSAYLAEIEGAKELLDDALSLYDERFWDESEGLSRDTYSTDFTVLDTYRGLNANMHTVEAFLAVADALGDERYRQRAGRIIDRVIGWAKDNNWRIPEHFNDRWECDLECNKERPDDQFKPYGATPGHGIEWSRLITQWAVGTYNDEAASKPYIEAAVRLYDTAVSDAWNCDGAPGIVYTTDWEGRGVVHDRMHWTLCEAINTSAVLHNVTGDRKYADDYAMFLEYLEDKVHDKVNGSFYHQLDSTNEVLDTVWPGKSDLYHAFQAMLIPYSACNISIAKAVEQMTRK